MGKCQFVTELSANNLIMAGYYRFMFYISIALDKMGIKINIFLISWRKLGDTHQKHPRRHLTHLSLASHKRDICKQCRPRSDATLGGIWSGSTLFALISETPIKRGNIENYPDTPYIGNKPVKKVEVEDSTWHKWVKKALSLSTYYNTLLWRNQKNVSTFWDE